MLLRFKARDSGGAAHVELDYTGTLISRGYVLAAAEIFDEERLHDSRDRDPKDENNWKALPGARHIGNLDTFHSREWIGIRRIEIHPLYDGYCIKNADNNCNCKACTNNNNKYSTQCRACANNKYSTLCKTCANIILTRKEHNVAVLQLKTFLSIQLHSNSPFLPICLPKSCGKTCRTWGGQTEEDISISGRDAFSKKFQDGSIQNLWIINNTVCKEKLNSWVSRKVKRFILYFKLLLPKHLLMYNSYVAY